MEDYCYDRGHIEKLLEIVKERNLSVPSGFFDVPVEELVRCYNGIGPECWNPAVRKLITVLFNFFESDALVHDYEWSIPGRNYFNFTVSNFRFLYNVILNIVADKSPGKNSMKIFILGCVLSVLCQIFGYRIYCNGDKICSKE